VGIDHRLGGAFEKRDSRSADSIGPGRVVPAKVAFWAAVALAVVVAGRYSTHPRYSGRRSTGSAIWARGGRRSSSFSMSRRPCCSCPAPFLTLGAGAVFGLMKGAVLISIAATLGATAAFLVGRYLAREWVAAKIQRLSSFRGPRPRGGARGLEDRRPHATEPGLFLQPAQLRLRAYVVGLLATVVVTVHITRLAREALARREAAP
jgi:hypothetical protein